MSDRLATVNGQRIRLLVVDDSPAFCRFLERIFSLDDRIEVIGFAHDAWEARQRIKNLEPDVITLDIGLPGMDGLQFLQNLMRLRPMPVVVLSAMTSSGSGHTRDALRLGAAEVLQKRSVTGAHEIDAYAHELTSAVKRAGTRSRRLAPRPREDRPASGIVGYRARGSAARRASPELKRVIVVGASTGGPDALKVLLADLHAPGCAVIIVQHMPEHFVPSFAARLDREAVLPVRLLTEDTTLQASCCYVVPGNRHAIVRSSRGRLAAHLHAGDPVNGHRPSVGVLFASVATAVGSGAIGVLLTGMGQDGSGELGQLHANGALTLVQDEATSVVWGMPGRAAKLGHADMILPIDGIAPMIDRLLPGEDAA